MKHLDFRGIRPDDLQGRKGLCNPERGFRTEMYASEIPGEIAGMCSCHQKSLKLDGRPLFPRYVNRLIQGNRLDAVEFRHSQWQDELDFLAYDGVTVMQSYVFLMKFSDGKNLSSEKLADIENFFIQLRRRRVKALLRFAYELRPRTIGPTAEIILRHLATLAPLIKKYSDVIYVLQCGFIGIFGEWHGSLHHLEEDIGFHRELFSAVLDILPEDRRTMVRYPNLKRAIFGNDPITEKEAFTTDPRARIGHFCDGFGAGPTHGGTYKNPDIEAQKTFIAAEGKYLPMDGELFWNDLSGVTEPLDAVTLFAHHCYDTFGFVHGHSLFQLEDTFSIDLWKRIPADPGALMDGNLPISDGYFFDQKGNPVLRSYYEYIRDHLGYRIELQRAEIPEVMQRGTNFSATIYLVNRGFSAFVNPRPAQLVLRGKNRVIRINAETDVRKWYGISQGETNAPIYKLDFQAMLPEDLPPGKYKVGFAMPDAREELAEMPEYAVRCANALDYVEGVNDFCVELECV